ncbi:iduronate 2-sulfatase isoform X2 [Cimex lectularius]|uniref:Sulfatase N-terminal domain-containing protein n=1 Tax=Cimex lectularius TaxID=79782 RepID=A0A8I6S1C3_CIMLE|nr:iduronate 2-sulfatase isoform X2 [Cimex lectularius]
MHLYSGECALQQSICAPSRNSFLTSRRPDTTRLYDFYNYWREFSGNYTTLPQYFKENGYKTKSIGKVFHPGISSNFTDDELYSWTETPFHPMTEKFKEAKVCFSKKNPFVLHRNIVCPVVTRVQPGKTLPDIEIAQEAIKTLKQFQNQSAPFFLAVGFHKPHIPLKYPYHYKKYHPLKKVALPKVRRKPKGLPDVAWNPWTDLRERDDIKSLNLSFPFEKIPDNEAKLIIQSYYAAVTYIDDLIGEVLKSLVRKNTIVVLLGDHGWSLGEHGEWSKFSNYEIALRVPFIIKVPAKKIYNNRIRHVVELVDLFPTLVELSGLKPILSCPLCSKEISTCTQGKSLVPLLKDSKGKDSYIALSQYPRPGTHPTLHPNSDKPRLKDIHVMGYSLRTATFRYTEWALFDNFLPDWSKAIAAELYDHFSDPHENQNVVNDLNYTETVKLLRDRLHNEINKYKFC